MGAPIDPGSFVAFSRETVSTAEFLSSTDTARTYEQEISLDLYRDLLVKIYLSIDFEPNISLCTTLNNGSNGHEADDQRLAFFNGDVHLFADIGAAQEKASGKDTRMIECKECGNFARKT